MKQTALLYFGFLLLIPTDSQNASGGGFVVLIQEARAGQAHTAGSQKAETHKVIPAYLPP